MKIHFNNKTLKIKKPYFPLKTEYFSGCTHLIESLNRRRIKYLKDLPEDLSELKRIDGVGQRRIEKLFDQILLYETTIDDTEHFIYKDKIVIPIKILNVPTSSLICSAPIRDFLEDVRIKRIGDLPSSYLAFKNVNQVGAVSIRKLAEELIRIKKLYENKRVLVLSRRNILISETFELSGRLEEFDYRLEDLPTDLRSFEEEPGFSDFIYELEKTIEKHETEKATKDFRDTFDKLLNGQGVLGISDRYAEIVSLRYSESLPTLQAVGDEFGLTRERVRQIVNLVQVEILRHYNIPIRKDTINRELHNGEKVFIGELIKKSKKLRRRRF